VLLLVTSLCQTLDSPLNHSALSSMGPMPLTQGGRPWVPRTPSYAFLRCCLCLPALSLSDPPTSEVPASSAADHPSNMSAKSSSASERPAARIDDSPSPSVGLAAAKLLDVEPEKERWRCIARDWYAQGLADTPGAGKLHHHLGLLSREKDGEELRAVYHFVKR
jgi:hypothetical protein